MFSQYRKFGLFLVFVLSLLLVSSTVNAQNRGFTGKIVNDKGDPVIKAKVTLTGVSSKRVYNTESDKKGQWVWMNLPAGQYHIVVRAEGYNPAILTKDASAGLSNADMKLEPGESSLKFPFEMTPEEQKKLEEEKGKQAQAAKMIGEIKQFFDAGRALAEQANYPGAIEQFKKALEKVPDEPVLLANMADAYFKNNQFAEAVDAYQKAIVLKPTDAALFTNLGVVYGKMGKTAESKDAFQKAADLDPAHAAQNFYNLGATLVNAGQPKDAAEFFRQAIKSDPNYAEGYYQLGLSLSADPTTMAEAVKMLEQYLKIGKDATNIEVAKQLITALKK